MEEQETTVRPAGAVYTMSMSDQYACWSGAYQCTKCEFKFIDVDDNFVYCPCCGRMIVADVED